MVRYWNDVVQKPVEDFFSLPSVTDSTAAGLKTLINEEFTSAQIPSSNLIGFASDNTNSMLGRYGGLAALLKQDRPWLIVFGCVCHSFALCATAACEKLPEDVVHFGNAIYNYVAGSSKRQLKLKKCQDFVKVASHAILYPSKTRWLVMENVAKRLLEQWDALLLFFGSEAQEGPKKQQTTAQNIHTGLRTVTFKLYIAFLTHILPVVNGLNVMFQSENVRLHSYLLNIENGLKKILAFFVKREVLYKVRPFDIDLKTPGNFMKLDQVYCGVNFNSICESLKVEKKMDEKILREVRTRILAFYVELCEQVKSRVNYKDPLLNHLVCLNPVVATSGKIQSIVPLYHPFKNILQFDIEKLECEWRDLSSDPDIVAQFKTRAGVPNHEERGVTEMEQSKVVSQDAEEWEDSHSEEDVDISVDIVDDIDPAQFWVYLETVKLENGLSRFPLLPSFMKIVMSLPHSSASAERRFSHLKVIKTPLRNKINASTISSLMHTHRLVKRHGGIKKFRAPHSLLKAARVFKK